MRSHGIHLGALALQDLKKPINKTILKFAVLKWHPGPPGANELRKLPEPMMSHCHYDAEKQASLIVFSQKCIWNKYHLHKVVHFFWAMYDNQLHCSRQSVSQCHNPNNMPELDQYRTEIVPMLAPVHEMNIWWSSCGSLANTACWF